ncbi:hypothetical protein BpHYR1_035730 [Brachionus plicatilis]|uniref:Uncharacterized protein n=1 Tax=Brachionus plicatilis TaxID=10195 RepID=A0A3M7SYP1_BRAPC|nr:hypothetical protein BpHYR1_035730 [Brachionus plicatilis]
MPKSKFEKNFIYRLNSTNCIKTWLCLSACIINIPIYLYEIRRIILRSQHLIHTLKIIGSFIF